MHILLHFSDWSAALFWNTAIVVALLLAFFIQLREGIRRRFDPLAWATVLAVVYAFLMVGERAGAFSAQDWSALIGGYGLPTCPEKTALGGALVALPVFLALSKWLRLPTGSLDVFLLPIPLAAAIGRIGCLMAGCCFGTTSPGDWGLCYGPGMPAHDWQAALGLIAPDAASTLPLMPVQLLFVLTGVLIFLLAWMLRKRFRIPGSLGWLILALLTLNRFGMEFFREVVTDRGFLGHIVAGLKLGQWICLGIAAAALIACWKNKQRSLHRIGQSAAKRPLPILTGLLLTAALIALFFTPILTLDERLVLFATGMPAVYYLAKAVRETFALRRPALASAGMLSAATLSLLMVPADTIAPSVQLPAEHPAQDSLPVSNNRYYSRWKKGDHAFDIGIGGTTGSYRHDIVQRDCEGNVIGRQVTKVKNRSAAFDAAYSLGVQGGRVGLGLRGITGSVEAPDTPEKTADYRATGPYMLYEYNKFGLQAGMLFVRTSPMSLEYARILPTLGMRIGRLEQTHFDLAYRQNHGWSFFPEPVFSMGVNFSFKDPSGAKNLRLGFGAMSMKGALFLNFRHPLGNTPLLADVAFQFNGKAMINMGLRYRFLVR